MIMLDKSDQKISWLDLLTNKKIIVKATFNWINTFKYAFLKTKKKKNTGISAWLITMKSKLFVRKYFLFNCCSDKTIFNLLLRKSETDKDPLYL